VKDFKICSECKKKKSVSSYYKDKNRKDGYYPICKQCRKPYFKKYRQDHKEEISDKQKQYYQDHKEEISKRWAKPKERFKLCKKGAKKRNLLFCLSLEQFEKITSQVCFYCSKLSKDKTYCGIDRVDNNVGYVLENCIPCCARCNDVKNDSSFEEIKAIYLGILNFREKEITYAQT
jgi:hypothetical protein